MRHLCFAEIQVDLLSGGMLVAPCLGGLVPSACTANALKPSSGSATIEAIDVAAIAPPANLDEDMAAGAVEKAVAERSLSTRGRRPAPAASSCQRSLEMNVGGGHEGPEV